MRRRLLLLLVLSISVVGCGRFKAPPVELNVRESLVGAGQIVQVQNSSNEALLGLEVVISAPSGESRTFTLEELAGYGSVEIGWKKLGGWQVPEAAEITVRTEGYLFPFKGQLAGEGSE